MIVTSMNDRAKRTKKKSSIAAVLEEANQSSGSNHSRQIEPQDAMTAMRRSRSCSSSNSGSIVSAESATRVDDAASFAAIKASRAELACLHATHKIETESLRQQIKHWKALATSKDQMFNKTINRLQKELEEARTNLTEAHSVRDKLRQRIMNIEERMILEENSKERKERKENAAFRKSNDEANSSLFVEDDGQHVEW